MKVITLLSDLGYNDTGVAKIKSLLYRQLPDITIIDITHSIKPFYLQQAAYLLASSISSFEKGTYTIAVYDIYYDKQPSLVVAKVNGQYIFAADNGLLPLAFGDNIEESYLCKTLDDQDNLNTIIPAITSSIDLIGQGQIKKIGDEYTLNKLTLHTEAQIHDDYIECYVVHIDNFENVVLNITKSQFEEAAKGRNFSIEFIRNERINSISDQYYEVSAGEKLCKFNSAGYMEIAINRGDAASLIGFKLVEERQKGYDTVKITFNDSTNSKNELQF